MFWYSFSTVKYVLPPVCVLTQNITCILASNKCSDDMCQNKGHRYIPILGIISAIRCYFCYTYTYNI